MCWLERSESYLNGCFGRLFDNAECLSQAACIVQKALRRAICLQDNLAQERKLLAGADTVLLGTLLSPVQAALLMLHAWPAHCDCFAFATAAIQQVCTLHCSMSES